MSRAPGNKATVSAATPLAPAADKYKALPAALEKLIAEFQKPHFMLLTTSDGGATVTFKFNGRTALDESAKLHEAFCDFGRAVNP